MAVNRNRRSTDAARPARARHAATHRLLGRFLARPVTGVFIVVPLLGAFLGAGNPSWLLTISGVAALYLAVDLLMSWLRRPVSADLGSHLNLVAWTAGIGAVSTAAWASETFQYHGAIVALVGVVAALAVGLGSSRPAAILWTVAAGAAVALGASVSGRLVVDSAMAATAIAVGAWFGAVIGLLVERLVPQARIRTRAVQTERGTPQTSGAQSGAKPSAKQRTPADARGRPAS